MNKNGCEFTFAQWLFCTLLLCCGPMSASATTINFDDIDASVGPVSLDSISPYQGYAWVNFNAYTDTPGFPGYNSGIISLSNAAFSGGESLGTMVTPIVGSIRSTTNFNFTSAYIGSGYYDNLDVVAQGLRGGSTIFTQTVTVNTSGAQLFNFDFTNIDMLNFFGVTTAAATDPYFCGSFNCTQFTVDNVVLAASPSGGPVNNVPEPASLAVFGLGGFAMMLILRRRAKAGERFIACLARPETFGPI